MTGREICKTTFRTVHCHWSIWLSALLAGGVFLLDVVTPRGMVDFVFYAGVAGVALFAPTRRQTILIVTGCSGLIIAGLFVSPVHSLPVSAGASAVEAADAPPPPHDFLFWTGLVNRLMVMVLLWGVAVSGLYIKRQALALMEHVVRLRSILDRAGEGIVVIDELGRIESLNSAAANLFGYDEKELVGQSIDRLLVPSPAGGQADVRRPHDFWCDSQAQFRCEMLGRRKNGTVIPVDLSVSGVPLQKGRIFTGVIRDATRRKQAEEALIQRKEFFTRVQQLANMGSYELRLPSHGGGSWSDEVYRILGRDPAQGKLSAAEFLRRIVHPEDRDRVRRYIRQAVREMSGFDIEYRIVRPDGSIRYVQTCGELAPAPAGKSVQLTGTVCDVTEKRRNQYLILQAERLAAIGQAMAGLAHKGRNALQRSQACLEMLARKVSDRPEALVFLSDIQDAQNDLHQLYEEVREYAAPVCFQPVRCCLDEVLRQAWKSVQERCPEKYLELRVIAGGIDVWCEIDRLAMRHVFRNILENSAAACPDRGTIEVRYAEAEIGGLPGVCVSFFNDGPAITLEERSKIFDPFYSTKPHGTGLGLAVAKRFVEAHGGEIAVGPECDVGVEILVTIPRKLQNQGSKHESIASNISCR